VQGQASKQGTAMAVINTYEIRERKTGKILATLYTFTDAMNYFEANNLSPKTHHIWEGRRSK
jgi:hypothetical protein